MDVVRRFRKPVLRRPRAVIAFEGWNDACDAASGAVTYLVGQFSSGQPFAAIEPEEFFDFQEERPSVEIDDGGTRRLIWPETRFYGVTVPGRDRDLVLVLGQEPNLRWKTFTRVVTQVLNETDVEDVVLLGAFIGRVSHAQPVPLTGVATDPDLVDRYGLARSRYEGPTGIIGVTMEACREAGLPAVSIWAAAPHYLAANANPKAMLALTRKTDEILDIGVDVTELSRLATDFSRRVDQAISTSDELSAYVSDLSDESSELGPQMTTDLVEEIEDFLRDQG